MPYVTAPDGVRLYFETAGAGPGLILHTGGAGDGTMWRDAGYVDALAKHFQCVMFDHRGHGRSDQPLQVDAHAVPRYVADLIALIDHLGLEQTALWGYSQGADIGLSAGALHPHRLSAIITTGVVGPSVAPEKYLDYARRLRGPNWGGLLERERWTLSPWFQRQFESTNPEMLALFYEAHGDWSTWDLLPRITAPVLMFVGELEDPEGWTDAAARRISKAQVVRIPGRDHITAYERSDAVLEEAMDFVWGSTSSSRTGRAARL